MTRTVNARLAGFAFLAYIALGFPAMVLFDKATNAQGTAAKLESIAAHSSDIRVVVVLTLLTCCAAFVLAVTLYGITRDEDHELAMLALSCRVGEGVLSAISILATLGLLWLGTTVAANAPHLAAAQALGAFLFKVQGWNTTIGATFFAAGSTLFSYLLLRGRMIPVLLAWLGVVASVLLVVGLPLQLAGFFAGRGFGLMWLPMAVFELTLGPWLLIKGVAPQPARVSGNLLVAGAGDRDIDDHGISSRGRHQDDVHGSDVLLRGRPGPLVAREGNPGAISSEIRRETHAPNRQGSAHRGRDLSVTGIDGTF